LVLVGIVAFVVYEKSSGQWQAHVESLLGSYSNVVIRNGLPANMGQGLLVEVITLALGVGLLPAIVSIAWFVRRMAHPQMDRRWVYVAASGIVMVVFLILTVYSQGGYLGPITEERYFFYVIPAFWLGAFAALEDGEVRARDLLVVAVGLALVYASIPFLSSLSQESAFLDPVESIVPHVFSRRFSEIGLAGLSMQDALAILTLAAGAVTALLWARGRATRLFWTVGAAVTAQLLLTGYAFAVIDGKVTGILGRTAGSVSALGWVDAHAGGSDVAWLDNLSSAAPPTTLASPSADQLRTTLFWNSSVLSWVSAPELGLPPVEVPMAALPGAEPTVSTTSGLLTPVVLTSTLTDVVGASSSPFLQLEGVQVAHSADGVLTLTHLTHPVRAVWVAHGLLPEGGLPSRVRVRTTAFVGGSHRASATGTALTVVFAFAPPAIPAGAGTTPHSLLDVRLGEARARVILTAGGRTVRLRLSTCQSSRSPAVRGSIAVRSSTMPVGTVPATLQSVALAHGACASSPRNRSPSH
jgi:hypothetical protein